MSDLSAIKALFATLEAALTERPATQVSAPRLRPEVCPHLRRWWDAYFLAQDDQRGSRRIVWCRACGLEMNPS